MEPHELIVSTTDAGVAARCPHVVAEFGVADHIDDHPAPVSEVAQQCAVDPDGLNRVLRLACSPSSPRGTNTAPRPGCAPTIRCRCARFPK